jgi:hypothetical protein
VPTRQHLAGSVYPLITTVQLLSYPSNCRAHPSNNQFNANPIVPFSVSRFYDGLLLTLVYLEEVLGWAMVYPVLKGLDQRFMGEAFVARPLKIRRWAKWQPLIGLEHRIIKLQKVVVPCVSH